MYIIYLYRKLLWAHILLTGYLKTASSSYVATYYLNYRFKNIRVQFYKSKKKI